MDNLPPVQSRQYGPRARLRVYASLTVSVLLFAWLPSSGAAQMDDESDHPRITAVRFWSLGDVTRIAIEATGEFHFKADRLENPSRIFFDLIGTRPQLGSSRGMNYISVADQFVRQIRVAETQRGITRVVLDLETEVDFSTSQLANPDRLIIELHPVQQTRVTDRRRTSPTPVVEEKAVPRLAEIDMSATSRRQQRELRMAQPELIAPPSPVDPGQRFATRQFTKVDPLPGLRISAVEPVKPPATRVMPGTLAKITPPAPVSIPETPVQTPVNTAKPAAQEPEAALPAKRTSRGDTMIRVLGLKLGRVVLDPGHGGHDAGTSGPDGLREKDVVLDVAKRLGTLIQDRLGSEVVFTRTDDTFIPLSRRTAIANDIKADLFLSIHVNSSPVRSVAGVETYYLNFTTSKAELATAMRENAGSDRNVGELQDLLKKIALQDKVDESREFASRIQTSLCTLEPKSTRTTRDRGIKRAPFVVLIGASMPSVLAEVGFISNSRDETMMRKPEYRQRIAEALYKGLAGYANSLSHFQVAEQSSHASKQPAENGAQ